MAKQDSARFFRSAYSIEQAVALHRAGRLDEADRIYGAILDADPQDAAALHLSGLVKYQQGRYADALQLVAAALKAKPVSTDAQMDYGAILYALNRPEEALASYDRLLPVCRDHAGLHYNRGNALKRLGRYAEALAAYGRATALAPGLAVAHHNRGSTFAELHRNEEALAAFDSALSLTPEPAERIEALNNRGRILIRLKRLDAALSNYDELLAIQPDHADGLARRGLILAEWGRYDEAVAHYERALRLDPGLVDAHVYRGNAFVALNRMAEALLCFCAAAALAPQNATASFNEGLTRLSLGDFRAGWKKYECRYDTAEYAAERPNYPRPLWHGEKDISGKTILLCAEQGMGDAIQFVRYAPLVAALGAKVLLGVHRPLATLLASVPGVAQAIADGGTLPHFDLYCPLLSLPLAFGTELATIPANIPYVSADWERIAKWRERLPQNGRLRIGICWAGTTAHPNNRNRSIALPLFARMLSVSGVDFVSLQMEAAAADAAILREHGVLQLAQDFEDFADTAAVIGMLDLVISVDTSVAHLAGAMGKPTAVLIPFSPDFRWMLDRTVSPWYPTMRLFRQSAIGDWDTPIERLRQELGAAARRPMRPL